ncbi:MAG: alpha/beta fold hydrolase [Candidatus Geothermincolia bacterium]
MKRTALAVILVIVLCGLLSVTGCRVVKKTEKFIIHIGKGPRAYFESRPLEKVKVGDIRVGYKTFGRGEPLFMIPAYCMTMEVWDPNFLATLSSRYKVVIFDNRGIGETTEGTREFTIDQFADDTAGLITALGYKQANVLGWSIGGDIALSLVVHHPDKVRKLVSDAGDCGGTQKVDAPTYKQVLKSLGGVQSPTKYMLGALFPAWWMEAHPDYWKDFPYPKEKVKPENVAKQDHAYNVWKGVYDELPNIKKPVLAVTGTEDVSTPPQNAKILSSRIPGSKLVEVPGAGHGLNLMYPVGFGNIVMDFLQ